MGRSKEIHESVKDLVVKALERHETYRNISKIYGISIGSINYIKKKFIETGCTKNKNRCGRPRLLTPKAERKIARLAKSGEPKSAPTIKSELNLNVSSRTVQRTLVRQNLRAIIQRKKPLISEKNRKKRLNFAKMHINKPLSFWKNIIWTDESKFEYFGSKKRPYIWVIPGHENSRRNIKATLKHGGGSVMVWGCFSHSGVGNLHLITGKMNAQMYTSIIDTNLKDSARKMKLRRGFIMQQNNDRRHKSRIATEFFKRSKINLLEWPPQSPDLNPIENLWAILDNQVPQNERTNNSNLFFAALQRSWSEIQLETLQRLVESVPARLQAVINAKGGNTNY